MKFIGFGIQLHLSRRSSWRESKNVARDEEGKRKGEGSKNWKKKR